MPRILPFKDPEPEEINGFKDITEAVIKSISASLIEQLNHMRSDVLNIAMEEPKWDALSARHAPGEELFGI